MAMIALMSATAAPGVTTSVALLAAVWPSQVIAADIDPAGGDLAAGWLGGGPTGGLLHPERSVLSFAIHTQHLADNTPADLYEHLQQASGAPNCLLLAGLSDPTQLRFVSTRQWRRVACSLSALSRRRQNGVDVLVDCGRFGPNTPMSVVTAADLVLIAVRPQLRHMATTRSLAGRLHSIIEADRLGLAVCATSTLRTMDVERWTGLRAVVQFPNSPKTARVFSDGDRHLPRLNRSRLIRGAANAASRLHEILNDGQPTAATTGTTMTAAS
jgi:hypothetical protein